MNLKILYVKLKPAALEALCRQAQAERRRPQDEAALLIERALGVSLRGERKIPREGVHLPFSKQPGMEGKLS